MLVRQVRMPDDGEEWLRMRLALFPEHNPSLIAKELDECAAGEDRTIVFIAEKSPGRLGGEVSHGRACFEPLDGGGVGLFVDHNVSADTPDHYQAYFS